MGQGQPSPTATPVDPSVSRERAWILFSLALLESLAAHAQNENSRESRAFRATLDQAAQCLAAHALTDRDLGLLREDLAHQATRHALWSEKASQDILAEMSAAIRDLTQEAAGVTQSCKESAQHLRQAAHEKSTVDSRAVREIADNLQAAANRLGSHVQRAEKSSRRAEKKHPRREERDQFLDRLGRALASGETWTLAIFPITKGASPQDQASDPSALAAAIAQAAPEPAFYGWVENDELAVAWPRDLDSVTSLIESKPQLARFCAGLVPLDHVLGASELLNLAGSAAHTARVSGQQIRTARPQDPLAA